MSCETYDRFQRIREELGDSTVLDEAFQYFSTDDMDDLCEAIEDAFDLRYFRGYED